ncbi:hypothetical protein ABFV50_32760, partial [Bacillus cereus]
MNVCVICNHESGFVTRSRSPQVKHSRSSLWMNHSRYSSLVNHSRYSPYDEPFPLFIINALVN